MNYRQMQEVAEGLHGPFWKYIQDVAKQFAIDKTKEGVDMIPESLRDMNEREQFFGASKGIEEIITLIPDKIKSELTRLQKLEAENTQQQ